MLDDDRLEIVAPSRVLLEVSPSLKMSRST